MPSRLARLLALTIIPVVAAGCLSTPKRAFAGFAGESPRARGYAHYMAAVMYQRRGQLEQAVEELKKALELDQSSARLALDLILTYRKMGDFDEARSVCAKAAKRNPDDPTFWMLLGWLSQQQGKLDEAVEAYQKAVALNPDNAASYAPLIKAAEEANDLIVALDIYEKLVELRPDSALFRLQLGVAYTRVNQMERAREVILEAVRLEPDMPQARNILGLVCIDLGMLDEAGEHLRQYLAVEPNDIDAREALAAAYARQNQYENACSQLEAVIKAPEAEAIHHIEYAYVLCRLGRYRDAAKVAPPSSAAILGTALRGAAYQLNGDPHARIVESLATISGDIDVETTQILGSLLSLYGVPEAGGYLRQVFINLREGAPSSKPLDILAARTCMYLEQYEEAASLLNGVLEVHGPDKWAHFYLASIYESLQRVEDAETHLKACLSLDPLDPEVMNFLGYMYAEKNMKLDDAESLLRKALELDPTNGYYLDSLGWVFYRKGDADNAIEHIRRAIYGMDKDDPVLRDHLGDAYFLRGDVEQAIAEWERAVQLDPTLAEIQDKIKQHRKAPSSDNTQEPRKRDNKRDSK